MSEEMTMRNVIVKSDQGWVVNYRGQNGRTEIVAVLTKTEHGCRAALFKAGESTPVVTVETAFGLEGSWRVVRRTIKGLMSRIGKHQRNRANRAARLGAQVEGEGRSKKEEVRSAEFGYLRPSALADATERVPPVSEARDDKSAIPNS